MGSLFTIHMSHCKEPLMSKKQHSLITRRRFIKQAAVTGAVLGRALGILSARAPSEKLNLVIIGCGGRGGGNLQSVMSENIVALCDVSEPNLLQAGRKVPNARKYRDFRKLYDEMKDSEF